MATTQNIPNTRLTTAQLFEFAKTPVGAQWALITIDRTISGGLNSLTIAETLEIDIERSTDGGGTWTPVAGITAIGGVLVTKGITRATETLTVGIPASDTVFRINVIPSTPVRVAGTVDYFP